MVLVNEPLMLSHTKILTLWLTFKAGLKLLPATFPSISYSTDPTEHLFFVVAKTLMLIVEVSGGPPRLAPGAQVIVAAVIVGLNAVTAVEEPPVIAGLLQPISCHELAVPDTDLQMTALSPFAQAAPDTTTVERTTGTTTAGITSSRTARKGRMCLPPTKSRDLSARSIRLSFLDFAPKMRRIGPIPPAGFTSARS